MLRKIIFVLMVIPLLLNAVGSDTAPSRQAFIRFPTGGDDTVYGFAALDAGFSLATSGTSFTFNSFMPVNTTGMFNEGSCTLSQDMICASGFFVPSSGTFNGDGHAIRFRARDDVLTLPLTGSFEIIDSQDADDNIFTLGWRSDENYIAVGTDQQAGAELRVYAFNGTTISATPTSTYEVGNDVNGLRWAPGSATYLATGTLVTPGLRIFSFNPANPTLTQTSTAEPTERVTAISFQSSGNYIAAALYDLAAGVVIYSYDGAGNLGASAAASIGISGRNQRGVIDWNPVADYIAVGTNASPFLHILYFDGSSTLSSALTLNVGDTVRGIAWSSDGSMLAVGMDSTASPQCLRIYQFEQSPVSLTEITSYQVGETLRILGIDWNSDDTMLAYGRISGADYQLRVWHNDTLAQRLIPIGEYTTGSNVQKARWSPTDTYLASGENADILRVYHFVDSTTGFTFNNTDVVFNSSVILREPIHCQDDIIIDGNGNIIDLNAQTINIDAGASLTLKNITLQNVTGSNIICANSAGTLLCENVTFELSGNFDYSEGQLKIIGNTKIMGEYSFTYSSDQNCTISSGAAWLFDSGMILRYDSAGGANNLFIFEDEFAQLQLYETTLYAPSTGLRLTKGMLTIEGECPVTSDATGESGGIWIGDGASAANDVVINILPESGLRVDSGYVVYKNVA